ncbi:MAG: hypothetical protein RLZ10_2525, partial [Bacteroidota bacterium]
MSFSIIICSYNPELNIFKRLLDAILNFNSRSPAHEIIIIDNNSQPSIQSNSVVQSFLLNKPNSRLIQEKIPGLTAARIAGISNSKYEWIIFFDDDNEPASDYLIDAARNIQHYP